MLRIILLVLFPIKGFSDKNKIQSIVSDTSISLIPVGGKNSEWTFQFSRDLRNWENIPALSPVFTDEEPSAPVDFSEWGPIGFFRTIQTEGFYDPKYVRTIELTFDDDNWASQLASNYATGEEMPGMLKFGNETIHGVGIRYKGNTSYQKSGEKKPINISVDKTVVHADLKGYDSLNFNNANMDQTLLKEVLYFNTFKKYAACPGAGFAQFNINGENWGVYSNVQQQDGSLIRQYFGENSGDRWKAPSGSGSGAGGGGGGGGRPPGGPGGGGAGGGGGGGVNNNLALLYLGDASATYENLYELKKQKTDNPWEILINAIDVLNNSPDEDFQNSVEKVMAVDSWLWFLVLENVFTDWSAPQNWYQFWGALQAIRHDVIVRPHHRRLAVAGGAVHGDVFAEGVAVADARPCRAAFPFQVLRLEADGGEREKLVAAADLGMPVDDDVRVQSVPLAKRDVLADDAVRANGTVAANGGSRMDDCAGMDLRHGVRLAGCYLRMYRVPL